MGRFSRLGNDLYTGRRSIDFVGRRWLWYSISGVLLIVAIVGLSVRGLNLGLEFVGGSQFTVSVPKPQATQANVDVVRKAVQNAGVAAASAPEVSTSGGGAGAKNGSILVTTEEMSQDNADKVTTAIVDTLHIAQNQVSQDAVGASWGAQVAGRALTGLIVFLVLVVLFIWAYFREWKASVAALVALGHDILLTAGVYALSGFQVTPATVTGFLTILGFSLYDTVVVFDKVRENTLKRRGSSSRRTYAQLANLAVNQTLVRSVNTSIVALLPVAALLYIGVTSLGSGDLTDLSLALFVGMAAGTYSSIFIASPLLAQLKERERAVTQEDRRAMARAKRDADRYADVPVFTDDMPLAEEAEPARVEATGEPQLNPVSSAVAPPRRPEATGSGRVVPTPKRPVDESGSAGRRQPTRRPRSKRDKK